MLKILLIGNSPLPFENTNSRPAAGLRTWQFLKSLLNEDCKVSLVTIAMPECYNDEIPEAEIQCDGYSRLTISKNSPTLLKQIQKHHDELSPDAIVSINTYPSYIAAQLTSNIPLWTDLNGWIMAESQAQAYKLRHNGYISHYFGMEKTILERADMISTVSNAQKCSVIGELAFLGRLNKENFGYDLVLCIPNASEFTEEILPNPSLFDGIPDDAFLALWVGGYNTWVDEETLFNGLEYAMNQCDNLYFVSTGGKIKGLDNNTFSNFENMIKHSRFKDRYKFLGWVDTKDIPYIYSRSHCGLNVDKYCIETLTGARNRINEMMKYGLPVITTLGSEISYECKNCHAGIGVESGDSAGLGDAIVKMNTAADPDRYAAAGEKYTKDNNYLTTTSRLSQWIKAPRRAPDCDVKLCQSGLTAKLWSALRYLRERGPSAFLRKLRQIMK